MLIQKLPTSWLEITTSQYYELVSLSKDETVIDELFEQLAIIFDVDSEHEMFDNLDVDETFDIIKRLHWMKTFTTKGYNTTFNNYTLKDFNKVIGAEFIDLDYYLLDAQMNLHYIAAILFKQSKIDEWGNVIEEPYIYNIEDRAKQFLNCNVYTTNGVYQAYLTHRQALLDNVVDGYANEKLENEYELPEEMIIDLEKEAVMETEKAKWTWEHILWDLSGNNLAEFDKILEMPIILIFNILAMKKSLKI